MKSKYMNYLKFFGVFILYYVIYLIIALLDNQLSLIMMNILLTVLIISIYKKELKIDQNNFKKNYKKSLLIGLKCWIVGLVIMSVSTIIAGSLNNSSPADNQVLNELFLKKFPIAAGLNILFFAPIIEEFIFRFNLRSIIKKDWLYLILSTVVFGSIHMIGGFKDLASVFYFIAYASFGFAFALSHIKTKTIIPSIIFHSIHNLIVLLITLL